MSDLKKEEYLIKKGKKRFVVLSGPILTWFVHPLSTAKGSLDVRDYDVLQGTQSCVVFVL
jgi:hypothetical protein